MISPDITRPPTALRLIPRPKISTSSLTSRSRSHENPYEGLSESKSALLKEKLDRYERYRHLPRVVEKNEYKQRPNKADIDYLLMMEREKHSPKSLSMLKFSLKGGDIDAQHYNLGKDCAHALAHTLDKLSEVEKINLQGNKLSSSSSVKILKRLHSKQTKDLNMSDNRVGSEGIVELADLIQSDKCVIRTLHLENCSLSSRQVEMLCEALGFNSSVKELNLARNHLGESCGVSLGDMLGKNSALVRLDLHWNNIRSPGAINLIEGLKKNDDLQEVDLSWNSLGQGDDERIAQAMKDWVKADNHVRHLDFSFNYISAKMCEIINDGLKNNHTIIGLHAVGNYCEIDSRGFLTPSMVCERTSDALISTRIVKQTNGVGNKCWICEKWVEVAITLEDASLEPPVFIHLECDNFEPEMMKEEGYQMTITRMVPPGKPRFFLSTLNGVVTCTEFESESLTLSPLITYYEGFSILREVSQLYCIPAYSPVFTVHNILSTQPRIPRASYKPPAAIKEKEPWRLPVSIMASYRFTTEELNSDCFEQDWKCSKIPKLIKDPNALEICKAKLKTVYSSIREAYRYYSAIDSGGSVFSVGQNVFTEIANRCHLIDEDFGLADLDLVLTSTNYTEVKNNPLNPANSMVRYKFLEVIVRIAHDKFLRRKPGKVMKAKNMIEALDLTLESFLPLYTTYNTEEWRWGRYLCEDVDLVLKKYKPVLDCVYQRFSGRKVKHNQKSFMSKEEWADLCTRSGLVNEQFPARETDLVYNLAMSLRIDELTEAKHLEMSFVEFLEALARACDKSSIPPYGTIEGTMSVEDMQGQPLAKKIENAMVLLLKLCPKSLQDAILPQIAERTGVTSSQPSLSN